MKNFTTQEKDAIRDALNAYCLNYISRNQAINSLHGISAATASAVLNSNYDKISNEMFVNIATQVGYTFDKWQIHESVNYKEMEFALSDAQMYKNVTWVVGDAGCGKTTAAIEFKRTHRNVFYILCSEDMHKFDFVRDIAKQVGISTDGSRLRDMLTDAVNKIAQLDNPILIFDEGDKLSDTVFNYFISIYNRLDGKSGIIFFSTDYIKNRMSNGLHYNKKGYSEINSRIGRRFFEVSHTTQNDIYAICKANGLTDPAEIKKVIRDAEESDNDLRRVKKSIHAHKRIIDAKKKN